MIPRRSSELLMTSAAFFLEKASPSRINASVRASFSSGEAKISSSPSFSQGSSKDRAIPLSISIFFSAGISEFRIWVDTWLNLRATSSIWRSPRIS